jgi:hypothetical protein
LTVIETGTGHKAYNPASYMMMMRRRRRRGSRRRGRRRMIGQPLFSSAFQVYSTL